MKIGYFQFFQTSPSLNFPSTNPNFHLQKRIFVKILPEDVSFKTVETGIY